MWTAEIIASEDDKFIHMQIYTRGSTLEEAQSSVEFVTGCIVKYGSVHWRKEPKASSQVNFETGVAEHQGYARFSLERGAVDGAQA